MEREDGSFLFYPGDQKSLQALVLLLLCLCKNINELFHSAPPLRKASAKVSLLRFTSKLFHGFFLRGKASKITKLYQNKQENCCKTCF